MGYPIQAPAVFLYRWTRVLLGAVAVVAAASVPVAAEDKGAAAAVAPERILTPLPKGWKVGYHAKDRFQEVQEFVPSGETVENWTAMVTTRIFDGLDRGTKEYNTRTIERFASQCLDAKKAVGEPEIRFGYETSLAFVECVTSPEMQKTNRYVRKVEFLVQLAIKGKDALYVAESAWHTDDLGAARPTGDTSLLSRITSRLDGVTVCDDRIEEKRCPASQAKAQ